MAVPVSQSDRAPGDGFLILWLGGPGRWEPKVQRRLAEAGVRIEDSGLDILVERASTRAPDLIVLTGAAAEAPKGILAKLAARHPARAVPVVAVGPSDKARPKPKSRFGLVAHLDREADEDALTKQLLQLLRSLSRRPAKWRIRAARADIPAIAERFGRNQRSGLLTAKGGGAIAFDHQAGVAPPPELLVTALGPESVDHLAFYERAPGSLLILDEPPRRDETAPPLDGARVLVIDQRLDRAQRLAARSERAGAQARAVGLEAGVIASAKSLDPTVIVVGAPSLAHAACEPLWTEPRLSAAALLVLSDSAFESSAALVLPTLAQLCALEASIRTRLERGEALAERLSTLGTARWLKLMGRCPSDATFRVFAAAGRGRVDLSGGRVRGAAFRPADSRMAMVEGRAAVDAMLGLPFGRVLAGPPDSLRDLEGVRGSRKLSVVGTVDEMRRESEPAPARERRPKGLVAEEIFAPGRPRPTPVDMSAIPRRQEPSTKPPEPEAGERAVSEPPLRFPKPPKPRDAAGPMFDVDAPRATPIVDLDHDDFEVATRNYTPNALAELQAELADAAKVSPSQPAPPLEEPEDDDPAAAAPAPAAQSARVAPVPPPKPDREPIMDPVPRPAPIAKLPEPLVSPSRTDDASDGSSSGTVWFVVAIVVAVAVGGYAAWQLSQMDAPIGEPVSPGPRVADPVDDPPEPPPQPEDREDPLAVLDDETIDDELIDDELTDDELIDDELTDDELTDDELTDDEATDDAPEPEPIVPPAPDSTVATLLEQAREAAQSRDYPRSETYARQALAMSPHDAEAAYRLAVALYRQRRHDEALTWAQRAGDFDPDEPRAHALQGDIHMRTGHFHSAADAYQAALEAEPSYGPAERGLERLRERGVVE